MNVMMKIRCSFIACFSPRLCGLLSLFGLFSLFFLGCHPQSQVIEPNIFYVPQTQMIENRPSAFEPLSPEELRKDWGKELLIAYSFAKEFDFYRAITGFKRALILIPSEKVDRRMQIEYGIINSYYLARKYQEVIETFECSILTDVASDFPPFDDFLVILCDSYQKIGQVEKANEIFALIEIRNADKARNLKISDALSRGLLPNVRCYANSSCDLQAFLTTYEHQKLSVRTAQNLNAILPGAGYYYVGQKKAAMTAFIINTLFTAAAYHFFAQGNIAAGLITTSLEVGWYVGGINGAGLAAKEYNERLYEASGKEFLIKQRLFPVLMLETAF